jgi:hypothetical protein
VLSSRPLREMLSPDAAAALSFGKSPDGTDIGPDDFATAAPASFSIEVPAGNTNVFEFHAEAELGKDRDAVIRVMLSDQPQGTSRDALNRFVFGDPRSSGYEIFRANMTE